MCDPTQFLLMCDQKSAEKKVHQMNFGSLFLEKSFLNTHLKNEASPKPGIVLRHITTLNQELIL